MQAAQRTALERFLAQRADARAVRIDEARLLAGGAIQENWLLSATVTGGPLEGTLECVLRADAPSGVSASHSRAQEFALLQEVFHAGVTVPEPLWLGDTSVFGRDFFVMRKARGTAAAHRLMKEPTLGGDRERLTERIGEELARLHTLRPPLERLAFLPAPTPSPALKGVEEFRAFLDGHHTPFPALEWGLRWLEMHAPRTREWVLAHRDFRTGNYMVDEAGLTAVLDWEFAAWSDPLEDLGWFCARCWRFGQVDKEAGGIGSREALFRGYARVSGREPTREAVFYWEVYAHVRWAVIALQQGERHVSGQEPSLELALTAHVVPELELEILRMTGVGHA
ncbi:phosphotransferase family protein [Corallococcus macrosporus]|uniref:Aminoglycoside phosphotransferase n=1 Tax=Corallococcus macrosporus DSM 14697 TaxID=1189310 RepID=A0A250JM21_9BACT|nr:phosphotransferase family protein [Corallococcus macrosporus]ATB44527.1 aminoglycoside phosphotransferase [Corallococcus macrosporus DSM 14697]